MYPNFAVDLRKIGVANQAIIVDNTPPIAGQVLDGSIQGTDLQFTKEYQQVKLLLYLLILIYQAASKFNVNEITFSLHLSIMILV